MSLTMGTGPFGHAPAGRFNVDVPHDRILYSDPSPRRIRAVLDGRTVLDSRRARMLHEHGRLPRYFVPRGGSPVSKITRARSVSTSGTTSSEIWTCRDVVRTSTRW